MDCRQQETEAELLELGRLQEKQHSLLQHFDGQIGAHNAALASLAQNTEALQQTIVLKLKACPSSETPFSSSLLGDAFPSTSLEVC